MSSQKSHGKTILMAYLSGSSAVARRVVAVLSDYRMCVSCAEYWKRECCKAQADDLGLGPDIFNVLFSFKVASQPSCRSARIALPTIFNAK
jgi:hypothetical protein